MFNMIIIVEYFECYFNLDRNFQLRNRCYFNK